MKENNLGNKLAPKHIPRAKGLPVIGQTLQVVQDPLALLKKLKQDHEDVLKVRLGFKDFFLIQTPQAVRHVLQENARNYFKPGAAKLMKRVLGNGLATSNGPLWLKQRRLMQPAFHKQRLSGFFNILHAETVQLIDTWKQQEDWQEVDVSKAFLKLTLNNISKAMFGTDVVAQINEIAEVLKTLLDFSSDANKSLIKIPLSIPTKKNLKFRAAEQRFKKIIYQFIELRKEEQKNGATNQRNDLLEMLLTASDDAQAPMSTQQLKDEITTIFMAGHETTSQTLSWIFYQLALQPAFYEKVKAEAYTLPLKDISLDDMHNLPYTKALIEEAMRFYPPVWIIARKAVADDVICGYKLPGSATVLVNVYGMHHFRGYWENPDEFNPENFLQEKKERLIPFSYLPFGAGQRLCIGHHFAMMVMQKIIPLLVREFLLKIPEGWIPTIDPNLTLRAKEGIPLLIKRTTKHANDQLQHPQLY